MRGGTPPHSSQGSESLSAGCMFWNLGAELEGTMSQCTVRMGPVVYRASSISGQQPAKIIQMRQGVSPSLVI